MATAILTETCAVPSCDYPRRVVAAGRSRYCTGHVSRHARGDLRPEVPLRVHGVFDYTQRVSYRGAHRRVTRVRGKASEHTCVDCRKPAAHWSYDGHGAHEFTESVQQRCGTYLLRYSVDPSDYSPRCAPCHRIFDRKDQ